MWKCLYKGTRKSIEHRRSDHLIRLLAALTSVARVSKGLKVYGQLLFSLDTHEKHTLSWSYSPLSMCKTDYPYLVGLVSRIVPTFLDSSDVLFKVLELMLSTIDRPLGFNELESIAKQLIPIFSIKSLRYLIIQVIFLFFFLLYISMLNCLLFLSSSSCNVSSLLSLLRELLDKDKLIVQAFTSNILRQDSFSHYLF